MKSWRAWSLAGLSLGILLCSCTAPNPRSCLDGNCTDPAFPYCDADGSLAGEPKACIAVACTPGEFIACQGSEALTCNAGGGDYDLVHCDLGCEAAADGCHLCEPNQTACTNGKVATCDANGAIVASEMCPLGCFEGEPRCRQMVPSNGIASVVDLVTSAPNIDLENATFETDTGTVTTASGPVLIPSLVANAGAIRVFVVNNLRLKDALFTSNGDPNHVSGPAIAFFARGDITLLGRLRVTGSAGGVSNGACVGGDSFFTETDVTAKSTGSGGGGNATAGARGGDVGTLYAGGAGGGVTGTNELVPLRGGCPSGGVLVEGTGTLSFGSAGGGAVQFSGRNKISVEGIIDARGENGFAERVGQNANAYYGGGAGGAILLEAPIVILADEAKLIAKGGSGGSEGTPVPPDDTGNPAVGTPCTFANCGGGGNGASVSMASTAGASVPVGANFSLAGGGGGGLGRIRVNAPNGTYTKSTSAIEAGAVTTGSLVTR